MARIDENRILSGAVLLVCVLLCCCQGSFAAIGGGRVIFTISGQVNAPMVTLKGLPGDPTSDASGFFEVTVNHGFSGAIKPYKEGWTFDPVGFPIGRMVANRTDVNFQATEIKYTVSGNVGLPDVKLIGFPGEPVSDAQGNYTAEVPHGWADKVAPHKAGYRFLPEDRTFARMLADRTRQNYVPSVIMLEISGSTGQPFVALKGLPGNTRANSRGTYMVKVPYGWKGGLVTPYKEGCTFSPPDRDYVNIIEDQLNQDYETSVMQFVISGSVGADGVEMQGLPGTVVSGGSGYFETQVDYGWNGKITPVKEGFDFSPPSRTVSRVLANRDSDNFEARIKTFTISGSTGVGDVQLVGFPGDPMVGPVGVYEIEVDWGWTGVVTPMRNGYTFTPEYQSHEDVKKAKTNQNFKHEILRYQIAGTTTIPQVKLTLRGLKGLPQVITSGPDGAYSTKVDFDWNGTITPEKEGYDFSPTELKYAGLDSDMLYESFDASLRKYIISGDIVAERGPVAGATILTALGSDIRAFTDEEGHFELEVDHGWEGQLSPIKEGYSFVPLNRTIPPVTMPRSGQGFKGTVQMLEISGTIIIDGQPVGEVQMDAGKAITRTVSGKSGRYSIKVPWGWSGEIRPIKEGWFFDPPSQSYTDVVTNIRNGVPEEAATPRVTPSPRITSDTAPPTGAGDEPREIELSPGTTEIIPPDGNGVTRLLPPEIVEPATTTSDPELAAMRARLDALQKQLDGTAASGSVAPDGSPTRSEFLEGDLIEALQTLATSFEVTIIPDATVAGSVSAELVDVTLEQALDTVLAATGFSWKKTEFYYLVTSTKPTSPGFMEGSETVRVKLSWIDARTAISLLSPGFQQYVQGQGRSGSSTALTPSGSTSGAFGSGYSLAASSQSGATMGRIVIVTAPRLILNRIVADLKMIDKKPMHVFLDARIVVMEKGNLLNMGIEWRWPTVQAGMFRNSPLDLVSSSTDVLANEWPWGMSIGYSTSGGFTNALEMAISLMEENGEARVVANPQVMTQDGKLAEFGVITEEYFMMTPDVGDSGFGFSRAELEKIESGTKLSITPFIGDGNDINLEVAVELSDSVAQGRGTDLPVVTRRKTTNTVGVRDGGTVALAGLTQNRQTIKHKRTPGLSGLPFIGGLFNHDYDDKSSREVAVFVTARLVPDDPVVPSPVSGGARPDTRRVPGPGAAYERSMPASSYTTTTPTGDFRSELRDSLLESRNNRRQ
jgi:hypothetical protein